MREGMEEREAATGLSEAREAAEAIAEPRIACFLRSKKPPNIKKNLHCKSVNQLEKICLLKFKL